MKLTKEQITGMNENQLLVSIALEKGWKVGEIIGNHANAISCFGISKYFFCPPEGIGLEDDEKLIDDPLNHSEFMKDFENNFHLHRRISQWTTCANEYMELFKELIKMGREPSLNTFVDKEEDGSDKIVYIVVVKPIIKDKRTPVFQPEFNKEIGVAVCRAWLVVVNESKED